MKFIVTALLMLPAIFSFEQDISVTVTAEGKSIQVSLDDDNSNEIITLGTTGFTSEGNFLTAEVSNEEIDKDWKRTFIIYDEEDNEMGRFTSVKENIYRISLQNIEPLLKSGKEYSLYTTILPKDPQKAMEVKIARQLVCKIKKTGH